MHDQYEADLSTLRAELQRRRKELRTRYRRVEHDLARGYDPLVQDSADQVVQTQNDATLEAIGAAAEDEVRQIDHALERMDHGLYGVCEKCRKPIPIPRLRIVPYASTCSACG